MRTLTGFAVFLVIVLVNLSNGFERETDDAVVVEGAYQRLIKLSSE